MRKTPQSTALCMAAWRSAAPVEAVIPLVQSKALFRLRDDVPLAVAVNSARRRWRRALRSPLELWTCCRCSGLSHGVVDLVCHRVP
jgi:hypothetical protein